MSTISTRSTDRKFPSLDSLDLRSAGRFATPCMTGLEWRQIRQPPGDDGPPDRASHRHRDQLRRGLFLRERRPGPGGRSVRAACRPRGGTVGRRLDTRRRPFCHRSTPAPRTSPSPSEHQTSPTSSRFSPSSATDALGLVGARHAGRFEHAKTPSVSEGRADGRPRPTHARHPRGSSWREVCRSIPFARVALG